MQSEHIVRSYFKIQKSGRPKRIYELTETGHELFPRRYDVVLLPLLQKLEQTYGHRQLKRTIESLADDLALEIKNKIEKVNKAEKLGTSLRVLNSVSNDIGFVSSVVKEGKMYSIVSRNCPVHKAALANQDAICEGFHTRMIRQVLDGEFEGAVQLKECMALGNKFSRHVITNGVTPDK